MGILTIKSKPLQNYIWKVPHPQLKPLGSLLPPCLFVDPGHTAPPLVLARHCLQGGRQLVAQLAGGGEEHHQPVPGGGS